MGMVKLSAVFRRLFLGMPKPHAGPRSVSREHSDKRKLVLSEECISYGDHLGREHAIEWTKIRIVWWSEPEYGYLAGLPYWAITGEGVSFQIDDWVGAEEKELPKWFARKLPGFDPNVVEDAFKRGYFKTQKSEQLKCWSRPGAEPATNDA